MPTGQAGGGRPPKAEKVEQGIGGLEIGNILDRKRFEANVVVTVKRGETVEGEGGSRYRDIKGIRGFQFTICD